MCGLISHTVHSTGQQTLSGYLINPVAGPKCPRWHGCSQISIPVDIQMLQWGLFVNGSQRLWR